MLGRRAADKVSEGGVVGRGGGGANKEVGGKDVRLYGFSWRGFLVPGSCGLYFVVVKK